MPRGKPDFATEQTVETRRTGRERVAHAKPPVPTPSGGLHPLDFWARQREGRSYS
jgi:hypothetical protein